MVVEELVVLVLELKLVMPTESVLMFANLIVLEETVDLMVVQDLVVLVQELTHVSMEFVHAHLTVTEETVDQMVVEELVAPAHQEEAVTLVANVLLFVVMVLAIPLPKQHSTVLKIAKFVEMVSVMELKIAPTVL